MIALPLRLLVAFLFFLSGFAALIYQVAWQRLLVVFAGGDVLAITIIVTAFMAGLGCGNYAGGSLADRLGQRRNLILFAVAEAFIAVFGLFSKALYYDYLYLQLGGLSESLVLTVVVLTLSLLLPTFLMGMSLPLLSRALIRRLPDAAVRVGRLYGVNTLGAAMGALVTTWALMPLYGIEGSIRVAVLLNLACALGMLPLLYWSRLSKTPPETACTIDNNQPCPSPNQEVYDTKASSATQPAPIPAESFRSIGQCLLIYALSGFIALALEMVWFRMLGVMLKSTAFTFGTLLGIYLGGVGIGSIAGTFLAARSRRPITLFYLLQCSIGLYAGLTTVIVLALVNHWPALSGLQQYFDSYEPIDANTAILLLQQWQKGTIAPELAPFLWLFPLLHLGLPLLMIGPPTFLMGLCFPLLQKAAHRDLAKVGRHIGWIQTANITGSMLGAIVVSTCFLPLFGTSTTLRLLVLLCAAFAFFALFIPGSLRHRQVKIAALITALVTLLIIPDQQTLWARAHGTTPDRIYHAEDGAGVSVLKKPAQLPASDSGSIAHTNPADVNAESTVVFVNGTGQSWFPFGGVHSLLGALPALLHPNPQDIAIIGLGSGDTLYSAASRPETRSIVCIEIIGAQLETLRASAKNDPYEALHSLLGDTRIRHVTGDGRKYLMSTDQRFDIIEADAMRPTSSHSGNLYSEEYFRLLSRRLKPGGYAVTWIPTQRVHDTFIRVFPYAISFPNIIIGSNEPIELDVPALQNRLIHSDILRHYERASINIRALIATVLNGKAPVMAFNPDLDRSRLIDTNSDLFPKDELALPALWD